MTHRLELLWERLRGNILFVPGVLVFLSIVLAVATVEMDRRIDEETIRGIPWVFRAGASGARDVLSTVATAMIQLAAITFSVTIVALALRSQQFGPRLLRNFTTNPLNQGVLGVFLGTFVHALLVLRAVRSLDDAENLDTETFVPLVSVTASIGLAILSLALFVVFIDRIVTAIQANSIIAESAEETHESIDSLFPEPLGEGPSAEEEPIAEIPLYDARPVLARESGYIQSVRAGVLLELACEADLLVRMEAPVGGFVVSGTPIAMVSPAGRASEEVLDKIRSYFAIGQNRSVTHDPEFGIRQIVDVAVKALSPSDNDPTTAVTATDYLGAILIDFATRTVPSPLRRDGEGTVRVIARGPDFRGMVDLALDQIREHGAGDTAATRALLVTIARVARAAEAEPRRAVLEEHVWKISRSADRHVHEPMERHRINELLRAAMQALGRDEARAAQLLLPLNGGPA